MPALFGRRGPTAEDRRQSGNVPPELAMNDCRPDVFGRKRTLPAEGDPRDPRQSPGTCRMATGGGPIGREVDETREISQSSLRGAWSSGMMPALGLCLLAGAWLGAIFFCAPKAARR